MSGKEIVISGPLLEWERLSLDLPLQWPGQAGRASTPFYTDFCTGIADYLTAGRPQPAGSDWIAFYHQAFSGCQGQHIAAHGFKFFIGYLYQAKTPVEQFISKTDGHEWRVDHGQVGIYRAKYRHEVEDIGLTFVMWHFSNDDINALGFQQGLKLCNAGWIGSVGMPHRQGLFIEPGHIAPLQCAGGVNFPKNRNACFFERQLLCGRFIETGFLYPYCI